MEPSLPLAHVLSDLSVDKNVLWGTLDNGFRYAILKNSHPEGRVSMRLQIHAGSLMEQDYQRGWAHYLEHLAFDGSKNYPKGDLKNYFAEMGMMHGADTNAFTSFKRTVYKMDLPDNDAKVIEESLVILRDFAEGLLLEEEAVESERGVVLSELRSRDSVDTRSFMAFFNFALGDLSLVDDRFPIGTAERIKQANQLGLRNFYDTWYRPSRTTLVVVGDIDADKMESQIHDFFAPFTPRIQTPPEEPILGTLAKGGLRLGHHEDMEASKVEVSITSLSPFLDKLDSLASREKSLLRSIGFMILDKRLNQLAEQEGSPLSTASCYSSTNYWDLDFMELTSIWAECKPENWQKALSLIEQELRRALEYGFTEAEFKEMKIRLSESKRKAKEQFKTLENPQLSDALINSIAKGQVFLNPIEKLALLERTFSSADKEQVHQAFQKTWLNKDRLVYLAGNLKMDNPPLQIGEVWRASLSKTVSPPQKKEIKTWTYNEFGPSGKVIRETYKKDLGIWQLVLDNQIRFNFKQTDFKADQVIWSAQISGGKFFFGKENTAQATFAQAAFLSGGLARFKQDELLEILAGKDPNISFNLDWDNLSLEGSGSKRSLETQLQLLTAYISDAGYRPDRLEKLREVYQQDKASSKREVEGVFADEALPYIFKNNPYFLSPSTQAFQAVNFQELKAILNKQLQKAYLEISIVGDIDYKVAKSYILKTLGALDAREASPINYKKQAEDLAWITPKNQEKIFEVDSALDKAMSAAFWIFADSKNMSERRRERVLASIFAERLNEEVRERLGEGYGPHALARRLEAFGQKGYLTASNISSTDKAKEVAQIIASMGGELKKGNISEEELKRVLLPILNFLKIYLKDNSYWLRVLKDSQRIPSRLADARTLKDDYKSITLKEINTLAKKVFATAPIRLVLKPNELPK